MIEDYETWLIGSGGARGCLPEHRSHIEAHIGWHQVGETSPAFGWRLRDWAEHAVPTLLAAWQRDVPADGGLPAGDERMAAIASTRRWSRVLTNIDPRAADPADLPALDAARDPVLRSGYPIAEHLPRLAAEDQLLHGHRGGEPLYRLTGESTAPVHPAPPSAQIAEATDPGPAAGAAEPLLRSPTEPSAPGPPAHPVRPPRR